MTPKLLTPLDPVLRKELSGLARRGRTYFSRILYAALCGIVLYMAGAAGGRLPSPSEYAKVGHDLFDSLVALQMAFLPIAAALTAADLVLRESRSGTLQVLLLSPLSGWWIACGKWKAVMAQTGTLLLCGAPVLAVAVALGGAGPWDLAWSLGLSVAAAALVSAVTIFYCATGSSATGAVLRALLTLGVPALLLSPLLLFGTPGFLLAAALHPLYAWAAAANPTATSDFGLYPWIGAVVVSFLAVRLFLMSAAGHLEIASSVTSLLARPAMRVPWDPRVPPWAGRAPVWERWALLWKELHGRPAPRFGPAARFILFVLLPVVLTLGVALGKAGEGDRVFLLVLCPMTLFLSVAVGASLFVRDKENRSFDMLLGAPLTTLDIVGTKLVSGVLRLEWMALLIPALLGAGVWTPGVLPVVLVFHLFAYVASAAASLRSRTYRGAFMGGASLVLLPLVALPLAADPLDVLFLDPAAMRVFGMLHPLGVLDSVSYPLPFAEALPGFVLIYGLLTVILFVDMMGGFRSRAINA